jgi:hypothetical protein
MYVVIKQSQLNGIEIKYVTIKLVDEKKLILHYMKQAILYE